jgi:protein TonB
VVRDQPFVVTNDAKTDPPTQTVLQIADPGPATISGTHTGEPAPVGTLPGPGNIAGIASGAEADGNGNEVVAIAEFAPEYPGGEMAFNRFLQKNIRYPQMAKETGIQGKAYLQFVVERDGSLTDIKIVRNPGAGTGEEAERVLKMSPHWKPGIQNGKAVRFQYTVPVNFSLGDQN